MIVPTLRGSSKGAFSCIAFGYAPSNLIPPQRDHPSTEIQFALSRAHIRRLGAFPTVTQFVLDTLTFGQRQISFRSNVRMVDNGVARARVGRNEPEALLILEPLYIPSSHSCSPSLALFKVQVSEPTNFSGSIARCLIHPPIQ